MNQDILPLLSLPALERQGFSENSDENTAIAVGYGTGSLAELMLSGTVVKPGVWAVEQVLSTELFEQAMQSRNVKLAQQWQ